MSIRDDNILDRGGQLGSSWPLRAEGPPSGWPSFLSPLGEGQSQDRAWTGRLGIWQQGLTPPVHTWRACLGCAAHGQYPSPRPPPHCLSGRQLGPPLQVSGFPPAVHGPGQGQAVLTLCLLCLLTLQVCPPLASESNSGPRPGPPRGYCI